MEFTENEIIGKYGKHCGHCNRNTFLPYEYEWTCVSCGFNLIKRKHQLTKIQRKKNKIYQSIEIRRTQNILLLCRCI